MTQPVATQLLLEMDVFQQLVRTVENTSLSATDAESVYQELEQALSHGRRLLYKLVAENDKLKLGYRVCPGGILNAYNAGSLNFQEAVQALDQ